MVLSKNEEICVLEILVTVCRCVTLERCVTQNRGFVRVFMFVMCLY